MSVSTKSNQYDSLICEDSFRKYTGVGLETIDHLVSLLEENGFKIKTKKKLIWLFTYLFQYETLNKHAINFGVTEKTFLSHTSDTLKILYYILKDKLDNPDLLKNDSKIYKHRKIVGAIDITSLEIQRPQKEQDREEFYDPRHDEFSIKFETIVSLDGQLIRLRGPFPGRKHNFSIVSNQLEFLKDEETILGCKDYLGDMRFITPFRKEKNRSFSNEQLERNSDVKNLRVVVDSYYSKIKSFKCLTVPWRSKRENLEKVFVIINYVVNYEMKNNIYGKLRSLY